MLVSSGEGKDTVEDRSAVIQTSGFGFQMSKLRDRVFRIGSRDVF